MVRTKTHTAKAFPDEKTRIGAIETLGGCCFVLADELKKHCDVAAIPEIVGYHIGLSLLLVGAMIGKIPSRQIEPYDLSKCDADYDQKLELVVDSLISLRDRCRKRRSEAVEIDGMD